jgi:hypothetical protein
MTFWTSRFSVSVREEEPDGTGERRPNLLNDLLNN